MRRSYAVVLVATALTCLLLGGASKTSPSRVRLSAFTYHDVTLTGGPMAAQAQFSREFFLEVPDDNLLNGFRIRAGLPAPGRPMGGWYDPNNFAGGCALGQYISALARTYANTGDIRYKEKVAELVHGFHETIAPDGFFFISTKISTNWPCYTYDKNCIGMRDAYTLTGDTEALDVLRVMTDWAYKNMPRRKDEWYTLPENLYNCYALTGDKRYLEMAHEYDYSDKYYDYFANGTNAFLPTRHAYSHVNSLASAAKIYEVTGDPIYLRAVSNAWEYLTGTQMYASGGWGPNERFVTPGEGKLAASLDFKKNRWHFHTKSGDYANNFETCCGTYANVNLDRYLIRFTGNPKYGDNMERIIFNGMLAALPMQPDGRTFYYSDYHPGARKQYFPAAWPCCSGTYPENTADYPVDVYFHNENGLYVNLFTPSEVHWNTEGKVVTVEQTTDFPRSDTMTFVIHTKRSARFALNVRVPAWATKPARILLNDRPMAVKRVPGTFLTVLRKWRDGDALTATFPMSLRFEPVDAQDPNLAALMYGPVMLVALADGEVNFKEDESKPEQWIQLQDPDSLTFRAADGTLFRPFYLITHERYTTYCNFPETARAVAGR
ncbi:MAG TPA: beta-L-arabinofuranosidase domain-containing protein [Candidatus Sulfotelmatobacter sp.]|nr:beta-L-arabinofuranosidase domain-containing protein [Candidatus Sulfotelmatobacter sp.]